MWSRKQARHVVQEPPCLKQSHGIYFHHIFTSGLLVFFCLYAIKNGAAALVKIVDDIQAK